MNKHQSSYRQIMKATSLFGGVQVFRIIISIVRSKFVAVLLGPSGMGIVGLLSSTADLITGFTNFGLGTSAVKNYSEANATGDEIRVAEVIAVLRRLLWGTGLLGAVITFAFSPWLSRFAFGNTDYTAAFMWISVTLLFVQLSTGELVLLQVFRKFQDLAKANLYGSLVGLIICVPIYYMFGVRGIVPVIIVTAFLTLFFAVYFSRKIKLPKVKVTSNLLLTEGKSMLVMGFMVSLSGLVAQIVAYLVRVFINHTGDVADVGFYTAGFTIINTYVGMVFTAMGTEYYPRLSAIADDNKKCTENMNQQAEIALLILAPILIIFITFIDWAIFILYSAEFLVITGLIYWAVLGIFFKAISWSISFIFLAKGDSKLFFWNELFGSIYTLGLSMLGYYRSGLTGLGIAFTLSFLLYLFQVFVIAKLKYGFHFYSSIKIIFVIQFLLALVAFRIVNTVQEPYSYLWGFLLAAVSGYYSFRELEKRIGIKEIVQELIKKIRKK